MEWTMIIGICYLFLNVISYFTVKRISEKFMKISFGNKIITTYLLMSLLIIAPFGSMIYVIFCDKYMEERINEKMNDIISEKLDKKQIS